MTKLKPSIDFGYPTKALGEIPAFQDIDEEAEFWDTHEVTADGNGGWMARLIPDDEFDDRLTVWLGPGERDALAARARERDMDTAALATVWLRDRLRHELEKKAS